MATLAELKAEPWWDRELITDELRWLGDELCRRTGQPRTAFGSKGNTGHLRGAHRSQEWIRLSTYCTSRSYTVQSGLSVEQQRHIAGADFVPGVWGTAENRRRMVEQTGPLIAAMRTGQLDEVIEIFGTLDGRTVTGYHNGRDVVISSDVSHLDHWHLTIDRRHLRNRALMERIVAIALGDDMAITQAEIDAIAQRVWAWDTGSPAGVQQAWRMLEATEAAAESANVKLDNPTPVAVDAAAVAAALIADPAFVAALEAAAETAVRKVAADAAS